MSSESELQPTVTPLSDATRLWAYSFSADRISRDPGPDAVVLVGHMAHGIPKVAHEVMLPASTEGPLWFPADLTVGRAVLLNLIAVAKEARSLPVVSNQVLARSTQDIEIVHSLDLEVPKYENPDRDRSQLTTTVTRAIWKMLAADAEAQVASMWDVSNALQALAATFPPTRFTPARLTVIRYRLLDMLSEYPVLVVRSGQDGKSK